MGADFMDTQESGTDEVLKETDRQKEQHKNLGVCFHLIRTVLKDR